MKNAPIFAVIILGLLLTGCKEGKSPLVDMTNAGADIYFSSNTISPTLTGKINVLEKYDSPMVLIEEFTGIKNYPKNGKYNRVIKKYHGKELTELSIENIYPVLSSPTKPNNTPFFIFGGVAILFIVAWTIVKLWRTK